MPSPAPSGAKRNENGSREDDMRIAAALFDLDGTLLDTLADLGNCMNTALTRLGYPEHPLERYRYFVGDGMETLARRCLAEATDDEAVVARLVAEMRREYGRRWALATRPYDGVPGMLTELAAMGLRLAVLSNKPHDFTGRVVTHFFPDHRFEVVWGARPEFAKKPDPAGALALAAAMDLAPAAFVYLGDTNTDMQTARAAGMLPVGACWGFRDAAELSASGARYLVWHPTEVVDLVRKLNR